ncbi:hypothetical protein ALUC_80894S [Aspergillus luchuensis]|nr:hypothetical protein ALUC_80894S [Aspergillus luchuensis]
MPSALHPPRALLNCPHPQLTTTIASRLIHHNYTLLSTRSYASHSKSNTNTKSHTRPPSAAQPTTTTPTTPSTSTSTTILTTLNPPPSTRPATLALPPTPPQTPLSPILQTKTLHHHRPRIPHLLQNGPEKRLPQLPRRDPPPTDLESITLYPELDTTTSYPECHQYSILQDLTNERPPPLTLSTPPPLRARHPPHDPLLAHPDYLRRTHAPGCACSGECYHAPDVSDSATAGEREGEEGAGEAGGVGCWDGVGDAAGGWVCGGDGGVEADGG